MQPDVVDEMIRYESGEMTGVETVAFFQRLIDSGLVWTLQGHYGRTAATLIRSGACKNTPSTDPPRLTLPSTGP